MARGGDTPEKPTQAEVERAEARAAERARREARRRKRADRDRAETSKAEKKDGPSWRERLRRARGESRDEKSSDATQRRLSAVVILLVAAVVIMALTDAAPFFDDTSEEERVADTVEHFFAAYRDGDHETMCSLFSPDVKQAIEQAGATETKGEDPKSCAEILAARVGTPSEDEEISVKVDEVRVSGPRAIANLVLKTEGTSRRQIEAIELEQGPDGWLLTSPVITS
jgi:ketosteroid isomerase-like protein